MVEQFMFECAAYMETASEQLSGLLICELIGASQEYPQSTVESNPEKKLGGLQRPHCKIP
jgi:hypothetical protein